MQWLNPALIASLAGIVFLACIYFYLYLQDKERSLGFWTLSWCVYVLRLVFQLWASLNETSVVLTFADQLSTWISGVLLLWGTYAFLGRSISKWFIALTAIGILWITYASLQALSFQFLTTPTFILLGSIYILTGVEFLRSNKIAGPGKSLTGWAFILWGLHKMNYPLLRPVTWFAPWGFLLASLLSFTVGLGMILVYYFRIREELRQDIHARQQAQRALQNQTYQQERLIETARYMTESLDLQEVLERIGKGAKDIMAAYGCTLYLLESDGKTLTPVVAMEDYAEQILSEPLEVEGSLTGQAVIHQQGLIFNNAFEEPVGHQIPGTPRDEDERVCVAPFIADGQVLGAMCLNRLGMLFTAQELALAETFAAYAATALKNAKVHAELQREVEERLQAQLALRESEERYRSLFENNQTVILLMEADTGIIVDANPAACRFYGYNKAALTKLSMFDLVDLPGDASLAALEYLGRENLSKSQLKNRLENGTVRDVEVYFGPIRFDGQELIYAIMHDVTDRVQREREMETVVTVATALRTAQTSTDMLPIILEQVNHLLQPERAAICRCDPLSGETVIELASGNTFHKSGQRLPPGEGIVGHVITSGKPYLTNIAPQDAHITTEARTNIPQAFAAVPLVAMDQTLGALIVGRESEISEADLRLLTVIAEIAASAIRRATLFEETQRRMQRLDALHRIDKAITTNLNLDATLAVLLDQITTRLGVDAADILLHETPTQSLYRAAGQGFHTDLIQQSYVQLGESLAGRAALERRLFFVPDLRSNGYPSPWLRQLADDEKFIAYVGVPLTAHNQVKGVLELFQRTPLDNDQDWWNFLDNLAHQAAIAIDNASLLADLQNSNQELSLAYDKTLEGWAMALELRDKETEGHSKRVTKLTMQLAETMGMSADELLHVRRGTMLHDIGKMGIPDSILLKPGPLSPEEWEIMHQHPIYAYNLLS
ncbi:MAG TPA: GAF domain-containing protein, partial [Anaerolineales bacterium]|nr:GAF domain-containing protein [Anaerolineales bacterium]